MSVCTLTVGCVFEKGHQGSCSPCGGHAITCGGRPGFKGICEPPCPVAVEKHQAGVGQLMEELKSQGVASATVKDGTVFLFSRAVIEELYQRLQADPTKQALSLFITADPAKLAARNAGRN
jgi:hypothetical protein